MKKITRKKVMNYIFDKNMSPVIFVNPGEEFIIETEDASGGRMRKKNDLPNTISPPFNPIAGPVYIHGAEEGDLLVVRIIDVIPDNQGYTCITPVRGPLCDSFAWSECREPYTHIIEHIAGPSGTTSDGKGLFNPKVEWDLHPMIGTIGVAPDLAESSEFGQGPWGGNIDCRDICRGTKVYLPIYNKGALLFVGDIHATQADTELTGCADETRAEIKLSCEFIKNKTVPWVRLEKKDTIIQLNSSKPLESAVAEAMLWLMEWLVTDFGFDKKEAYMHMSINPLVRVNIYQMVLSGIYKGSFQHTVGVEFPKKILK